MADRRDKAAIRQLAREVLGHCDRHAQAVLAPNTHTKPLLLVPPLPAAAAAAAAAAWRRLRRGATAATAAAFTPAFTPFFTPAATALTNFAAAAVVTRRR